MSVKRNISSESKKLRKKVLAEESKKERFLEVPSFAKYVKILHKRFNEEDSAISNKKHHPDMHYVGASDQCLLCDQSERSAKERYDYDFPK